MSILPPIGAAVMEFENVARGFFHARVKSPTAMRQKNRGRVVFCRAGRNWVLSLAGFTRRCKAAKARNFEISLMKLSPVDARVPATIQHGFDEHGSRFLGVVNGVRESFREQTVIVKNFPMDAGIQMQGINVRKKRFQEITAQTFLLVFVKPEAVGQIVPGRRQNDNFHVNLSRSCFLAVSQSMNDCLPDLIAFSRSCKTSPCHAGDSTCASLRLKSAHNASIARNFSATVILSNGSVASIFNLIKPLWW